MRRYPVWLGILVLIGSALCIFVVATASKDWYTFGRPDLFIRLGSIKNTKSEYVLRFRLAFSVFAVGLLLLGISLIAHS